MDFSRLQAIISEFNSTNNNVTSTSVPSTVLEMFVPGYSTIAQLTFRYLGFDIGVFVTGWLVLFGLYHGAIFTYGRAYDYFTVYYTSSVVIDESDILYDHVMSWIAVQHMPTSSRRLTAATRHVRGVEDADDSDDGLDEYGIFNNVKWAGNIPPVYQPSFGDYNFYHQGRWFSFARVKKEQTGGRRDSYDEQIVLCCRGRGTEPIKQLLIYVKRWSLNKASTTTSIYQAPNQNGRGERYWRRQSRRSSRPLSTVALDQQQKGRIVADINEYLNPATARWYAARGIPHRRGYLFHGPPGTGKTSLSFALAGIFGLDVYCLSLNDGITESELSSLLNELPRRCFLLLEDIDAAGIRREGLASPVLAIDDATSLSEATDKPVSTEVSRGGLGSISLSGLLNVIDGAASHEGHVLIMTTNTPDKLDDALTRPGRVDLQIGFTLATRDQIRDMYMRMFNADTAISEITPETEVAMDNGIPANAVGTHELLGICLPKKSVAATLELGKLGEMAQHFADALPEKIFSPAEVQGYLLMHKMEPKKAIEEVSKWKDEMLEMKKKKKKKKKKGNKLVVT
ncbi:BCS1 N terminal-domain-containing protein [Alternaria alternata]|nr:BCS1 N terminal-domain-containing protein [Alternaria alternata]